MRVRSLKNSESGKRAFILANGPSILKEDLNKLKGELVIGMNASSLLDAKYGFFSKFHVVSDHRFLSHPEKRILAISGLHTDTIRVLRRELEYIDEPKMKSKTYYVRSIGKNGFSENLAAGYYFGCTTTMLALQLAYYIGCKDAYLLGCDLKYSEETPRFYEEKNPQLEDSFTSTQIYNIARACSHFSDRGGNLYNCSRNSFLRPYLDFFDLNSL